MYKKYFNSRIRMLIGCAENGIVSSKENKVNLEFIDFPINISVSSTGPRIDEFVETSKCFGRETTEQLLIDLAMQHCDTFKSKIVQKTNEVRLTLVCSHSKSEYSLILEGKMKEMMRRFGHWVGRMSLKDLAC